MATPLQSGGSSDLFTYTPPLIFTQGESPSTRAVEAIEGLGREMGAAGSAQPKKLGNVEVFDHIREVICSITTPNSKSSGFFLTKDVAVVSFHSVVDSVCKSEMQQGAGMQFSSDQLRLQYNQNEYPVAFAVPLPSSCSSNQRQVGINRYLAKVGKVDLMVLKTPSPVCN